MQVTKELLFIIFIKFTQINSDFQASGATIISKSKQSLHEYKGSKKDILRDNKVPNVGSDQVKYLNFWIGIRRRIEIQKLSKRTDHAQFEADRANFMV